MFCNADLFPTSDYLAVMAEFFERRPLCGAAIGKILRYELDAERETDVIDTAGLVVNRQRRFTPRGEGERDIGQFDQETEVFALDGAAMIARRVALESIRFENEYLDESFVTHKEDHDISWRLRLGGWECWYVPNALAFHAANDPGARHEGLSLGRPRLPPERTREVRPGSGQRDEEPVADVDQERGRE